MTGNFRPAYNPNADKINRIWNLISLNLTICFIFSPFLFTAHYFIFPHDPSYPYTNLTESFSKNSIFHLTIYFTYGILNFYLTTKMHFIFLFLIDFLFLSFFILVRFITKELRLGRRATYKTSLLLRTPNNITKYYRSLQLLFIPFNQSLTLLNVWAHLLMLIFSVFLQVNLVVHWNSIGGWMKTIFITLLCSSNSIWLCSLEVLGRLGVQSTKTIKSWTNTSANFKLNRMDRIFLKKFQLSCKPIMISYRGFYVVRRSTILAFLKMTNRLTFRTLLTFKK